MLGSTGSIGTQTLEIVSELPDKFKVVALSAGRNIDLLTEQVSQHKPEVIAIEDENLLTDAGKMELLELGRRYQKRLPTLFATWPHKVMN